MLTIQRRINFGQTNSRFKKTISYASKIACVAFLFWNSPAQASKADLKQIETYLNNIKNLTAKFTQTSESGIVEGKFFLSRPGKMRVEYNADPKVLIVVNGSVLSYYDVELDEISRLSTNTTPASFLTRQNISFEAKDVEVTDFKKSENEIKVSVVKKNRKEAGEFSLIFKRNPLQFIKMEVKNDLNQIVTVKLSDVDFTSEIPSKMFILKSQEE